ncbi:MAG: aminotransferase class I/II-fold pyridoxal phosphate-dependent enzyme [Planctomycetota bacterium]|nr:MAG: aminotransferase class I/II-fold pyridoxal phosphate-dependent enzyme [Planctomycetota bacterium]
MPTTNAPDPARSSAAGSSATSSPGPSTAAVHAGEARQKPGFSLTDPIFASSTYTFPDTKSIIDFIEEKHPREEYGRYGNPGERVVEDKLAALEGGEQAVLFASGMAALVGLLMAHCSAGDEIVFFDECYHRSREFCRKHLTRFGVGFREVKTCDYAAMEAAITPKTKFLVSESPTNPHLSVVDVERFADLGRRRRVLTLIDATLCTPYNLKPLAAGVDFVLHSATKYLGGHNDLLAGTVIGRTELMEPVRNLRGIMGGVNSPHNAYLLERGLKTLALRMERHNANGLAVARFLESHPRVERVLYPGLESHPFHDVAARTMRGCGGLVTFFIKDSDWRRTADVVDAVKIPRIGPSLGGVESLIEQPLVMSYWNYSPQERQAFRIHDNMIRMACGIEDADDLIADLAQALDRT